MELIFIRHTSVNVPPGTCYGQTDVPVSDTFPEEADAVLEELRQYEPFDAVYTSPLTRCVLLAEHCGHPRAIRDRRLLELNFGDWEMKQFNRISDPRLDLWFDNYIHYPAGGGESFIMQLTRVSDFIDEVLRKPYNRVAVFAHGGILVSAEIHAGRISLEDAFNEVPPYGSILKINM